MPNKEKQLVIYHHLGLGDHFICNGMVRYLTKIKNPSKVYVPTWEHNISTVSQMYSDDERISCLPVLYEVSGGFFHCREQDAVNMRNSELIKVGFEKCRMDGNWDISFYDSVGISFDVRWDYFQINRNTDRERKLENIVGVHHEEKFILVHDESSAGKIPIRISSDNRVIKVTKLTDSMLDWCGLIERAEEVHCIDSSLIHLAQGMNVKSGVFHYTGRVDSTCTFVLKTGWKKINDKIEK